MPTPRRAVSLKRIASEHLGFDALRPGQEEGLSNLLAGHDTLVVMPTGGGKSAIYQMAALLIPGVTVVVSPLIALQRDQAQAIDGQDVGAAAVLNSTLGKTAREQTLADLENGSIEFLFLAPEQLANAETLARVQAARPSLFVVDEAHCICAWGHDFRPDYLNLGAAIAALGHPRVLALTATAAPPIRQEIVERLGMRDPAILVQGFDRPNIDLSVERVADKARKHAAILARELEARRGEVQRQLAGGGMTVEDYLANAEDEEAETEEEFWATIDTRSEQALKAQVVLDVYADEHSIDVSQQELTELIFRKAQQNRTSPQDEINHMMEHNHMPEWMQEIRRGKALAAICADAKVTDADGNAVDTSLAVDPIEAADEVTAEEQAEENETDA